MRLAKLSLTFAIFPSSRLACHFLKGSKRWNKYFKKLLKMEPWQTEAIWVLIVADVYSRVWNRRSPWSIYQTSIFTTWNYYARSIVFFLLPSWCNSSCRCLRQIPQIKQTNNLYQPFESTDHCLIKNNINLNVLNIWSWQVVELHMWYTVYINSKFI